MELRGINFGPVWGASGVQGFFGEGYWYHKWIPGLNFKNCTFVAKTTTLAPRPGNMPLEADGITPKEWKPKCIVVKFRKGVALNAVGLSGPGAMALLDTGRWQARTKPFFLSFMSVEKTAESRQEELRVFVRLLRAYLPEFKAPVGLQINYSCPNVGLHVEELVTEVCQGLKIASALEIPLVPKFNVLLPVEAAREIARDPNCDALCNSNTIPWGALPELIDWKGLFGSDESPLKEYGGGGLSGRPLMRLTQGWVAQARAAGITKPINAGGGIMYPEDVDILMWAGASSVFVGSVAMLRGWRVRSIIRQAHAYVVEKARAEKTYA